jgi:8-oxo-dGTP diphosphatase
MVLLLEIKDKEYPIDMSSIAFREASRAVVFDENGLIPMLYVSKENYHKLPGGGIEEGEDKMEALKREVIEEAGCEIDDIFEVGMIIEFRSKWDLKQISYCYYAKAVKEGQTKFTDKEKADGFKLVWMKLDEAIAQVSKDLPKDYEGKFIQERDLTFLKEVKKILKIK